MFSGSHSQEALSFYAQRYSDNPATVLRTFDPSLIRYYGLQKSPDASGALGINRHTYTSVACQSGALDLIIYGVTKNNRRYIKAGLKAIRYGFRFQRRDGSFYSGETAATDSVALSAAVFFIATAASSLVLLQNSSHRNFCLKQISEVRHGLERAIRNLSDHKHLLIQYDQLHSHRLMHNALAFCLCGELFRSATYMKTGMQFLKITLLMQKDDGVFKEEGGYDSSYQATTLLLLQYALIFLKTPPFFNACLESLTYGLEWQKTRISVTGDVLSNGNTRTGNLSIMQSRYKEKIHYSDVIKSLFLCSTTMGDQESHKLAKRVFRFVVINQS